MSVITHLTATRATIHGGVVQVPNFQGNLFLSESTIDQDADLFVGDQSGLYMTDSTASLGHMTLSGGNTSRASSG